MSSSLSSSQTTMKALYLTRPSNTSPPSLSLTTLPIPTPTPGYVLIKIHYASIQPSDRLNAQGGFPKTTFPRIPGRDYAGTVVTGTPEKVGTEVYGSSGKTLGFELDGPHAEYCLIPEDAIVEKPRPLSLLQAATIGVPFLTALLCLRRARASTDDIVLVLGASGAVGSASVQIAKAMGCKRVLTASRTHADITLTSDSPTDALHAIPDLTSHHGVDVIVDNVGSLPLMSAAFPHLATRGRYVWIASPRGAGAPKPEFTFDIFQAYRKEIELVGCNTGNYTLAEVAEDLRVLKGWFDSGVIKAKGEEEVEVVGLDEAVERGYSRGGRGERRPKPVVIRIP